MSLLGYWLRRHEIMGMNYRNRHLVEAYNPKPLIALAKNKIATKQRLQAQGIPVPGTIAEVRFYRELAEIYQQLLALTGGFVVKPACSSRGNGVMVCSGAEPDRLLMHNGSTVPRRDFEFFISQVLYGEYSYGRPVDVALFEQRIQAHKSWIYENLPGPPDLRIIVRAGRAIMAMARVPTRCSGGRANLHCGGLGVGIDLESGMTTHGVQFGRPAERHPDTGVEVGGHEVSAFTTCVELAERAYSALPLGYMGVDLMYDASLGPVIIELNARPGLAVQIANRAGLRARAQSIYEEPVLSPAACEVPC
jgi:alpha-L-glutamate ligase-like protein